MPHRHTRSRQPFPAPPRARRRRAALLPVGAEITVADKVVGTITSSAPGIALGYVRREVEPPAPATVDGLPVDVRDLPH